ncbi:MAG: sel1 repeat family protein [Gammaproteobacteria bacterium]|nr:sel1 repeat family protein [Gammaproteobacteria bacterium]
MNKLILLTFVTLSIFSFNLNANPTIEKGFRAYQDQDYIVALTNLRPLAEEGDAYAQYVLGVMYAMGQGVARNDDIAIKLYRKSADQGHADAQFAMGKMYKNARAVTRNYTTAIKWFRKAKAQEHPKATVALEALCEQRSWLC